MMSLLALSLRSALLAVLLALAGNSAPVHAESARAAQVIGVRAEPGAHALAAAKADPAHEALSPGWTAATATAHLGSSELRRTFDSGTASLRRHIVRVAHVAIRCAVLEARAGSAARMQRMGAYCAFATTLPPPTHS